MGDEIDRIYYEQHREKFHRTGINFTKLLNQRLIEAKKILGIKTKQKIIVMALEYFLDHLTEIQAASSPRE